MDTKRVMIKYMRKKYKQRSRASTKVAEERPIYKTKNDLQERKAIEASFPFEAISTIAEIESWRKEIYRPIYHIHKWWAQRLGSVFRAIIIGACTPIGTDITDLFYKTVRFSDSLVYDPFMGSGTTIGEAHKMGCKVIGRDINPVSYFIVKNALSNFSEAEVRKMFRSIEHDVADEIKQYYRAQTTDYGIVDVLYYFWVKVIPCPTCGNLVDLFDKRIFTRHAYPRQHSEAKSLCPACDAINSILVHDTETQCNKCRMIYNPQEGHAHRAKAFCPKCGDEFLITSAVKTLKTPPQHRMYAKMILKPNGTKEYHSIDEFDKSLYEKTSEVLKITNVNYPTIAIEPGYNTDQVLKYNYQYWYQMFNDRQLLCLSILAKRIREIEDITLRSLFVCLFSGCLEFNNMFCSFKGEGTGAVRHMFSHHILKPERTPLEANIWGTPKSSGSFSTLFESRILRALAYQENPFELKVCNTKKRPSGIKTTGINQKIGGTIASSYKEFSKTKADIYLSCGSSCRTDIPDGTVDAVITDPPFFDNVYYSQLADFFYVWQKQLLGDKEVFQAHSTRHAEEVQQADTGTFVNNLSAVFEDCHRVLKHEGLLIFTYHHSRNEGWSAIIEAIRKSDFYIEGTYPVKSEMSVAMPKHQAKEPIDLDIIIVCRKLSFIKPFTEVPENLLTDSNTETQNIVERFNKTGKRLSRNDIKVILIARLITTLSRVKATNLILDYLDSNIVNICGFVEKIWNNQVIEEKQPGKLQLLLF